MLTRNAKPRPDSGGRFGGRGVDRPDDGGVDKPRRVGVGLSLKGRALKYLSQREHSRVELARKLARYEPEVGQVDAVLDELEQLQLLSGKRFVESLVSRRSARFGLRRIVQELGQHHIDRELSAPALGRLKDSEFDRAREIWRRRFGQPPADMSERARQHRFLAQRGFTGDTISKVLKSAGQAEDDESA